jgi:hypothetical protein
MSRNLNPDMNLKCGGASSQRGRVFINFGGPQGREREP